MADNSYKVEAEISTSNSVTNLRALNKAIDETTSSLKALNTVTKEGEADLASMARSITSVLAAQRQAAAAEKDLAQAKIATARATADATKEQDRQAESASRVALNNARAAQAEQQGHLATTRAANEYLRTESQLTAQKNQSEVATQKLALAQQQYADRQQKAKQSELELQDNLSNTRYLLYDVGATYRALSIGLEAIPVATAAVAASYQRDFAQVVRVTESSAQENEQLRQSLKGIADDLPVAFGDLTKIAQLGAQMGIPTAALSDFTEVTAKFVAVTGVAADTASSLFGRLDTAFNSAGQIPDFFNKVGASIAKVGADTVATDPEIAAMLNQIGSLGASAGFTADQTIGLAAALASVRVQPELARGTLTRLFANLDRDVSSGGKSLDAYAKLLGVTAQQAAALWKQNPEQFFTQMIGGLNKVYKSGGDLTATFDGIGIKAVRDVSSLTKLAVGYDTLTKSMDSATQAYADGTALEDQSKPIFETIAAKLQMMVNAFQNLADTLGRGGLAPLGIFIDALTGAVKGVTDLAKTSPAIMTLLNVLLGFSAVAGVFMGLKAAQAFVLAGLVAYQQLIGSSAGKASNFSGIIKQVAVTQLVAKGATEAQANALLKEASAFGAATFAARANKEQLALLNVEGANITTRSELAAASFEKLGTKMGGASSAFKSIGSSMLSLVGGLPGLISLVGVGLVTSFLSAQAAGDQLAETLGKALNGKADDAAKAAGELIQNFKVSNLPSGGLGFNFDDYDKTLAQIADRAGVSIDKMVADLKKGKDGLADFKSYLDQVAKSKGYDGIGDIRIQQSAPWDKGAADLYFISQAYERVSGKAQDAADASKKVDSAVTKAGAGAEGASNQIDDLSSGMDGASTAADKLDKALKAINDTIFGFVDQEAAMGDALEKLGEGLQKSGQFNNSEDGRANVKNMEDALAAAQKYYALQQQAGRLTKDQATSGYDKFVNDLIAKAKAEGANLGPIEDLAHQTAAKFKEVIGTDATGPNAPTMQVKVDTVQPVQQAQSVGQQVSAVLAAQKTSIDINANADQASQQVYTLALSIAKLTGMPVEVVIDALTNPASDKAKAVQDFINKVVADPKSFSVNADTTAAVQNVQNFASYAAKQLAAVQNYVNSVAASAPVLSQFIVPGVKPNLTGTPYKPGLGGGSLPTMQTVAAPAQVAATNAQTQAQAGLGNVLDNVNAGYDKQQAAADKAGKSGSKAGKDSANAWQDAGNAIDEATSKADDYASRLKQGLDRAFEKQYGVQTATDAYYQKLNEIKKAREDELKQVDDLHDKIKSLNDEMNKDKIDAGKAKIEQQISLKYGEADRAVDYGNQAQTALDNAAAKQKEIDADTKQANEIQAGIGLLTGYSDAAIKNRQDLRDLEQKQLDMVVAYAKTGASIDQVRAYAQNLDAQFQNDVTQIGFNRQAVQNLTGDLGRYIDVINRVPYEKPTKITADPSQAEDAIKGVGSDFNALGDQMANNPLDITLRANWDWDVKQISSTMWSAISNQMGVDMGSGPVKISNYDGGVVQGFAGGGMIPGTPPSNPQQDNMFAKVDGKGFITVRSGEGIMTEPAMKYYGGAGFLDALNKMKLPRYAMGGVVGRSSASSADPGVVSLDAASIAAVADALSIRLEIDGHEIGRAANRYNRDNASMGGRR
ncbi:MAG: phage tail tape measure protein [Rhodanobacter sp.]